MFAQTLHLIYNCAAVLNNDENSMVRVYEAA